MPFLLRLLRAALPCAAALLPALPALAQYNPHPRIWLTPERIARIGTLHVQPNSYEWRQVLTCAARDDMDGVRAQALAYAVTSNESYAQQAVTKLVAEMDLRPVMAVNFNSCGRMFNNIACAFDWLYNSAAFTPAIKARVIAYVNAVPAEGDGKWNWYPDLTYFNGTAKMIWGPPLWGLATAGDNPNAQVYIDNGYDRRWVFIRNALGYGPANLATKRGGCMPQGLDYASGTMSFIMRYVDAVKTATGQDLFDEGPALKQYLEFFVKSYYYTEDFIRRPEHGHNAHKGDNYTSSAIASVLIAADRYRNEPEGRWASWWLQNIEGVEDHPGNDYRYYGVEDLIWSDPTIPQESLANEPLAYFAEGNGMWTCRSNWTSGATEPTTYATFRAGNWTWFNQNHWDQGNYCIYSHGADLLVDGGIYDGAGGTPIINYHHQTIAHNSLLVKDPQQLLGWHFYDWTVPGYENTGGQNVPYRETYPDAILDGEPKDPGVPHYEGQILHDMSDLTRRADNARYTYAFANLTNAYANTRWEDSYAANRLDQVDYRPKVTNVTRHWFYLRGQAEYFVTFDRVSSVDAAFQKASLLHFIGEPALTDGVLESAEIPGHVETWRGNHFAMEYDGAVLHGAVVLPENSRVRKIGGRGYEYWVNGTNQDAFPDDENPLGGVWRLELMPPQAARDDLFLTVLHPNDAGTAAPAVARIPGSTQEGASVAGWVCMFAKTETDLSESAYSVAMGGSQRHLVCDMAPGYSYRVYRNGDPTPLTTVTTGEDGIVEFVSPGGGSFQVTQGEYVPDSTPPTGSIEILGGDCLGAVDVQLRLQAQDGQSGMAGGQMRFSNDGANWSAPQSYAESASWTLSAGDGAKTAYARFADAAGNWMDEPAQDGTALDQTAPEASFDIVEDEVASAVVTLACAAGDAGCGSGALSMRFSNDGLTWEAPQPFASTVTWTLAIGDPGTYTVYAAFGDAVGNWTDPPLEATVIVVPSDDLIPPTGTVGIQEGACLADPQVTLNLDADDGGSGMAGGWMRFSNDGANWSTAQAYAETASWILSAGDGINTVRARFADAAGNWMDEPAEAETFLDQTAPEASFDIAQDAVYSPWVTLICAASDAGCGAAGSLRVRFSNDGLQWSDPAPVAESVTWELADDEPGTYTVYAIAGDAAGNWTAKPLLDEVLLLPARDTTPPEGSLSIAGGDCLGDPLVTLELAATDGESGMDAGWMQFSHDGGNWSTLRPYAPTAAWILEPGDGGKTVHARFVDAAGNWSAVVADTAALDDSPPTGSVDIVESEVHGTAVTLACTAEDTGCGGDGLFARLSNDGSNWSAPTPLSAGIAWELGDEQAGAHTVSAIFGDAVGNWSDPPVSDTVLVLDDQGDLTIDGVLGQNFPNPLLGGRQTVIAISLPRPALISVFIYDATGRLIKTVCKDDARAAGSGQVVWDGTDDAGHPVRSGIYFCHLRGGGSTTTRKMVLLN